MNKNRTCLLLGGIALILILLDQWSKWYVKTNFHLYEIYPVLGDWFNLYFIENEGMAFGWKFGGSTGKLILTLIRIVATIVGFFFIRRMILRYTFPLGFLIFVIVIYAGAIGNMIDSIFYGVIYEESTGFHIAQLFPEAGGYGSLFYGKVVDMLYFPIIKTQLPEWLPFVGGNNFVFFSPIFNLADSCVSVGTFGLLIFYRKILLKTKISAHENSEARP